MVKIPGIPLHPVDPKVYTGVTVIMSNAGIAALFMAVNEAMSPVAAEHRLCRLRREVDDRKPAVTQCEAGICGQHTRRATRHHAGAVAPTVRDRVRHRRKGVGADWTPVEIENTRYAAHGVTRSVVVPDQGRVTLRLTCRQLPCCNPP